MYEISKDEFINIYNKFGYKAVMKKYEISLSSVYRLLKKIDGLTNRQYQKIKMK